MKISEFKHFLDHIDDRIRGDDPRYSQHDSRGGSVTNCSGVISTLHASFASRYRDDDAENSAFDQTGCNIHQSHRTSRLIPILRPSDVEESKSDDGAA